MRASLLRVGLVVLGVAGCGDGGATLACSTCENVAGTWNAAETVHSDACGTGTLHTTRQYVITQTGCEVTLAAGGSTFTGAVCDSGMSWTGHYPLGSGTTTINSASVTLAGTSLTGTLNWSWTNGTKSCTGTTDLTAPRG